MAKKKSAPYVPHRFKRYVKVKNKKRKDHYVKKKIYYYWWLDEDGKKHYASTGLEDATDADEAIKKLIENKSLGKTVNEMTLAEYAEPFFAEETCPIIASYKERKKEYSKDFMRWKHGQVKRHVIDKEIGEEKLVDLTTEKIQDWLNKLPEENGLRNVTANKQRTYLKEILDVAVMKKIISTNPCDKVKTLPDDSRIRPAFTEDEIRTLFIEPWEDVYAYVACLTAADTGLRISEVRALKRSAIKEDKLRISISYARSGERSTKNKSVDDIPVSPTVRSLLLELAGARDDNEYIFSKTGEKPLENKVIYESFYEEMQKRGIDRDKYKKEDPEKMLSLSFHSFRRALNTILLDHGVSPTKVRAIMRHKTPSMTEHYTNKENFDFDEVRAVQNGLIEKKDA